MKKLLTIALTVSALALGTTFAGDCPAGGGCSGKKDGTKKEEKKESVYRAVQF